MGDLDDYRPPYDETDEYPPRPSVDDVTAELYHGEGPGTRPVIKLKESRYRDHWVFITPDNYEMITLAIAEVFTDG